MRHVLAVCKRTLVSFYDDQMTHHAAALTYYGLMSLFPALLLGISLLGLIGQYPETYNAILDYLRGVAPPSVVNAMNDALKTAFQSKSTAATGLVISILIAFYGMTGVLEASRRALNVVFEAEHGRSFLRRKAVDLILSLVLVALILISLLLIFVGGGFAEDLLGFAGFGHTVAHLWDIVRWPAAFAVTVLIFSLLYYVTPDVEQRGFRWVTPGAFFGVTIWLAGSVGFSEYISNFSDVGAIYGTFAGAIILVGWMWLTNVAMLLGAELDAEIEREVQMSEGVAEADTLNLPAKSG